MRKLQASLIKQVQKEYADICLQVIRQEMYEEAINTKYFPKLEISDKDVVFTGTGHGKHRMIPYWHGII